MKPSTFHALAETYLPILEQDLAAVFDGANLPEILDKACRYSVSAGGKRLRPMLVFAAFLACQDGVPKGVSKMARRAAVCVELLHTYSLIHDDLPCMDDDELRRGKLTCHIVFGEDVALLAGDVLQSLAFESLVADLADSELADSDLVLAGKLTQIFAPKARRMVAGQMRDVLGENQALSQSELETIHKDKTGALIEASLLMGAVCAGADDKSLIIIENYAKALGLAFQVQDDVLDVVADTATLGKPAGSDEKLAKSTYVKLLGVGGASDYADSLYEKAIALAGAFGDDNLLIALATWLKSRKQ